MKPISHGESVRKALKVFSETGVHRLAVIQTGNKEKIDNILTQSDMIQWLLQYLEHPKLIDVLKEKIGDLNIGSNSVHSIQKSESALAAFKVMAQNRVTGIPIVDEEGKFVGAISAKELKVIFFIHFIFFFFF